LFVSESYSFPHNTPPPHPAAPVAPPPELVMKEAAWSPFLLAGGLGRVWPSELDVAAR
jgi:hypothetical protein